MTTFHFFHKKATPNSTKKMAKKRKVENNINEGKTTKTDDVEYDNPLLEEYTKFLHSVPKKARNHFFSPDLVEPDQRSEIWAKQAEVGEDLINRFSWAIPNDRLLNILEHFSPLVEIGSGANAYIANLLLHRQQEQMKKEKKKKAASKDTKEIDILTYDTNVKSGGKIPSVGKNTDKGQKSGKKEMNDNKKIITLKGGPEVLSKNKEISKSNRTLVLCYPDEDVSPTDSENNGSKQEKSLGFQCLDHYKGTYIIHIGELYGDTLSMDQAPYGRSSSCEFQERLASEYHCLLKASLPNWLHVRDTVSVWKRTQLCTMVFAADSEDEDDEDEVMEYKYIPPEERVPSDIAAPCLQHLLHNKKKCKKTDT